MKTCRNCGQTKDASKFSLSAKTKDSLHTYCKTCDTILRANRRMKKIEELKLTFNSLNNVEKNVWGCIRYTEFVSMNVIFAEAKRIGMNRSISDLKRICKVLVENGLALENNRGEFKSIVINHDKKALKIMNEKPVKHEEQKEFGVSDLEKVSKRLQSIIDSHANHLSVMKLALENIELAQVRISELEEQVKSKSNQDDKEFQAFLAFKAAIKG